MCSNVKAPPDPFENVCRDGGSNIRENTFLAEPRMTKTQVLRECLQGMMRLQDRFDLVREEDAAWICERLLWHKLMPLAAALGSTGRAKCAGLNAAFQQMLIQNLAREQHYFNQVKAVFTLLENKNIRFTPFKGPFWGTQVYPQYSWRHIGDIDLIMSADDARAAAALLKEQGYLWDVLGETAEDDFRTRGELACYPTRDMPHLVPVELHWELMPAPRFLRRHYLIPQDFATGATAGEWRSIRFSLPTAETRLLYLILHATCQHQFNRFVLLMDMAVFIHKHPRLHWTRLFNLARERGCLVPLHYGLSFVSAFCDIPAEAREIVRMTKPKLGTRLVAGWLTPQSTLHFTARRGRTRRKLLRVAMSW